MSKQCEMVSWGLTWLPISEDSPCIYTQHNKTMKLELYFQKVAKNTFPAWWPAFSKKCLCVELEQVLAQLLRWECEFGDEMKASSLLHTPSNWETDAEVASPGNSCQCQWYQGGSLLYSEGQAIEILKDIRGCFGVYPEHTGNERKSWWQAGRLRLWPLLQSSRSAPVEAPRSFSRWQVLITSQDTQAGRWNSAVSFLTSAVQV